jgi:hypothetical protein
LIFAFLCDTSSRYDDCLPQTGWRRAMSSYWSWSRIRRTKCKLLSILQAPITRAAPFARTFEAESLPGSEETSLRWPYRSCQALRSDTVLPVFQASNSEMAGGPLCFTTVTNVASSILPTKPFAFVQNLCLMANILSVFLAILFALYHQTAQDTIPYFFISKDFFLLDSAVV